MSIDLIKTDLSVSEVAQVLGKSKSYIYAMIHNGLLRRVPSVKRGVRVNVAELERYLADYHAKLPFSLGL